MRDRRYRRSDGYWNDYNQAVTAGASSYSARLQAEAGETVAGDLAGQLGLPAQIGAHRFLIAGMPIVVPENGVDAVFVSRVVGRGGKRPPGGLPYRDPAIKEGDRPASDLGEIGRRERADRFILGKHDNAAGPQDVRWQPVEPRPDRPDRLLGMRPAVVGARHDRNRGGAPVEPMRRLGRRDPQHIRQRRLR